jgi:ElaB/YqjD/DUF883 family membrane-anchored ribosome-binding protein
MGSYDAERAMGDAQETAGAVAGRMGAVAEQAKGKAAEAAERASGALTAAQERGSAAASEVGEAIGSLREALNKSAREQPGTTVLLSVAAGFLLGALWRSGR